MFTGAAGRVFLTIDLQQYLMALTTQANAESSKHMGHEWINSSVETVETEQLKWKEGCGNMTSSLVILDVTSFGYSWGEKKGPSQYAGML